MININTYVEVEKKAFIRQFESFLKVSKSDIFKYKTDYLEEKDIVDYLLSKKEVLEYWIGKSYVEHDSIRVYVDRNKIEYMSKEIPY